VKHVVSLAAIPQATPRLCKGYSLEYPSDLLPRIHVPAHRAGLDSMCCCLGRSAVVLLIHCGIDEAVGREGLDGLLYLVARDAHRAQALNDSLDTRAIITICKRTASEHEGSP
jgi:hypothetical protein